ncbi:MAG: 4Fe-4S binding protein [Methanospirillaceae archaeon]|nr:4Fe-4S binding protein [Methanospirillaceae archaeon]
MKLLVTFYDKGTNPIIAKAVMDTGVLINVERAVINSSEGEALVDVPDDACHIVGEALKRLGADVRIVENGVSRDLNRCVSCGACISICPKEVFSFDDDWMIVTDEKKCILCGRCVLACPHQALTISY